MFDLFLYGKCSKITNTFLFLFSYKMLVITAGIHKLWEIDHEIISKVILLPSADSFKKGCCQLQAKVCAQITG